MSEENILKEIEELKSMMPSSLLESIKSRNLFMRKVKNSFP